MEQAGSIMETIWKRNYIVGFYFSILLVLLLCVITTPLLIRHGISITDHLMVEEEVLETVLILALLGISFLILIRFTNRLKAYQQAVNRAVHDKSKLVSRLTEAFRYIGKVNVEIQEIESVLCGVAFYPQSKREFRRLVDRLALRAMTIAASPWLVVRMVDRHSGQTVNEHAVGHPGCALPPATLGNRALLDGVRVDGLQTIGPRQQNLDLLTVFILPTPTIPNEKTVLLIAILNQIEMLFILHSAGCIKPMHPSSSTPKEIDHDSDH
jgi:uncharacterized protein YeeX (DUF496 family)